MIFNRLTYYKRQIILGMLPLLFLFLIDVSSFGQNKNIDEAYCANVKWAANADVVTITYDLVGNPQTKYKVDIVLKKEINPEFHLVPFFVEGDIGDGYFAGSSKQIIWYYQKEFPQGLKEDDGYYFEIHVKSVEKRFTWIYYAVGAAAVTGGMIALLAGHKGGNQPSVINLPTPPGRP